MQTTAAGYIENQYLPALTGARAFMAYFVYLCHFVYFNPDVFPDKVNYFMSELYIGVSMFFVLSGFLITWQYYDKARFSFRDYMVKRMARIYPMYFILTTAFFIYLGSFTLYDLKVYLLNISFLRGFFLDFHISGIASGWSLTPEEIFYLITPFLFVCLRRSKWFLLLVPVGFLLIGLGLVKVFENTHTYGFFANPTFMFNYTICGRISEFVSGIALALLVKKYGGKRTFKYATYVGLAIIFAGVCALAMIKDGLLHDAMEKLEGKILNTFLIPIFGILPLYWGLVTQKTWISKGLEHKLFQVLGKSSYIFYLVHIWFLIVAEQLQTRHYILEFLALNVICVALYYTMELPINQFIRGKFSRKQDTSLELA